jgi:hypothetical protein
MSAQVLALPLGRPRHTAPSVAACTVLRFPTNDRRKPISDEMWAMWEKRCPLGRDLHAFRADILSIFRGALPQYGATLDTM